MNDEIKELLLKDSLQGELLLYIKSLEQENEKLNHYKLLYQKVKDRNDKAIEYINDYGYGYDCSGDGYYCLDEDNQKELEEILKGNNETE